MAGLSEISDQKEYPARGTHSGRRRRVFGFGKIEDGRLHIRHVKDFEAAVSLMKGEVTLTVEEWHAKRSLAQNRYYFGVIVKFIGDHMGEDDPLKVHEALKEKFNPVYVEFVNKKTGEVESHTIGGQTRRMTKDEFGQYCDRIKRWAAEFLGVVIPDPDQIDWLSNEQS